METLRIYKIELLLVILGVLLGISYFFMPLKMLVMLSCALAGTILIFWKLEIGIFSAVFLLPFLPTFALLGITSLVILSFIIRIITNDIKIKFSPLSIWLLVFAVIIIFCSVFSITPISSVKVGLVYLSYLALYFVTINTITSKKLLYLLMFTLICSASLEALYGIYQYKIGVATLGKNWTDESLFPHMKTRVFGTLDNPNILAQYLELIIPVSFGLFLVMKDYIKKIMFLCLTLIMLLCLVFTFSRGGWIALTFSIIIFSILKDRRLLLIGGILGLSSIFFLPEFIMERITSIGNLGEASNSYRTFVWFLTLGIVKDYWFSGIGLGVDAFQKIYNVFYIRDGVCAYHAHNLYLQMLVETGVLGTIIFMIIIFITYKYGLNSLINTNDDFNKTMLASLLAGFSGFLLHGIVENSFYNFKIVFLFWFIVSIIMTIREMNVDKKTSTNIET